MKYLLTFLSTFLVSCSNVATINKEVRKFGAEPSKIIWFQIAGLELEHLSMLRFNRIDSSELLNIEQATCSGAAWNYNLYELRPNASESFLGQTLGSMNITNECKDLEKKPLWNYLSDFDYKTVILESGADKKASLLNYSECSEFKNFLSGATLVEMKQDLSNENKFHFQETKKLENGKVYVDKSCSKKECLSSLYSNTISLWENILRKQKRTILQIRDYSYAENLKKGDISQAREVLTDIERLYSYFSQINDSELLILVTSGEPLKLNFPIKGKSWLGFINTQNSMVRRSSLLSPVLATGARAENLCGIYNESEIIERILWEPEKKNFFDGVTN